ncbi:MAG: CBS domain-containing protein [Candidatus Woesearchaeota archaeon]|nr:CBS domain-containing protein [Candidatus Woesearchaeota archaeon]
MVLEDRKIAQLRDYIAGCQHKGMEKQHIIDTLLKSGWSFDSINSAFEPDIKEVKGVAEQLTAEDIMDTEIVKIAADAQILDAIRMLRESDEGYALVMEKDVPVGIITGKDVMKNINDEGLINILLPCSKVMTSPILFAESKERIFDICEKMKLNEIERIPVLKKGKLIGIIDTSSLINLMSYD